MQRKRLEDMNLLDDFLFNAVMTFPGIGERFCRLLLQVVLGREIGRLRVVAQRAFGGRDEGFRGARLDVLAEEELMDVLADPSVFDIEPDNNDDVVSLKDLPKRVRFYHAIIDSRCLKKGEGFGKLKRVFVIFVCSYDPFDRGRMVYTIRNPSSKFLFSGKNTCLRADLPPPAAFSTGKSYCSGCRSGSPHHPDHTALPEAAPSLSPFPDEGTESAEAVCFLICNFCQTPVFFPDKPLKNLPASVPAESLFPLNCPPLFKQIITLYIYTVNKLSCRNFYSLFITDYTTRFSHISHCLQKLFTFRPFYCMMA